MPNISGMTYAQARETLDAYGLFVRTASGVPDAEAKIVTSQSIKPGSKVDHGTVITVTLVDEDESMLGKY